MKAVIASALILTSLFTFGQILDPVDWKFAQEKSADNEYTLIFSASIENRWHLYSQHLPEGGPIPTSFYFENSDKYQLIGEVEEISEAEEKYDASFGMDLKMFSREAIFKQKLKLISSGDITLTGSLEYMCCDDERCLPPTEEEFSFSFTAGTAESNEGAGIQEAESTLELGTTSTGSGTDNEDSEIVSEAKAGTVSAKGAESENSSLWVFFLIAFVAGLAGILTPCVFPMIPMTVSFFMQGSENRGKAVIKGLIFGISIIAIYTAIGVIVSISSAGAEMTNSLSTHWIPNLIFFLLFMAFAASFLGMFELVLPSKWVNSADKQADKGGYMGAFFMAFTLVLVSFSCTGPIVGALLVEAAGGLALKPILGMFGFGLAFALPFTLFAIFPSWLKGLPKSGGWLNSIKVVLGFIVLAFGMKFLSSIDQTYHLGIMSREVYLSIWIVIFTLLGFYLLGKIKFAHDSELPHVSVPRLLLAIVSFSFVIYMVPGLFGANLSSISALIPPKSSQEFDISSAGVSTLSSEEAFVHEGGDAFTKAKYSDFLHLPYGLNGFFEYEEGMAYARANNLPVLLDFKGHACSNCKEMEGKVWSDPGVLKRLREDYLIIALYTDDRTKLPEEEWIISEFDGKVKKTLGKKNMDLQISQYNTNTQPFYVLVDPNGSPLAEPRGHNLDIHAFTAWLDSGIKKFGE
ncbi:protein-disulfide reductase DsbD family protein [Bacteroidota bacterium]